MYQKRLSFGEAVSKDLLVNYCNFSGRASRSEYWWFVLFQLIVSAVLDCFAFFSDTLAMILIYAAALALLLPGLGLSVRRMHDIGKGGGWIFINLVPFVGWIFFLVWTCQDSQPGPNRFGDEPNMVDNNETKY